jgi:hypothetical protein
VKYSSCIDARWAFSGAIFNKKRRYVFMCNLK